ncbi:MAG TPA: di-heme oxidoredictase family protein, partial [Haliangium sp.]|nr:di-heme oxidoredictase family protein [Haliangium sp.]
MNRPISSLLTAALVLAPACAGDPAAPPLGELPPAGGATTTTDRTSSAYENPAFNLSDEELEAHLAGDLAFEQVFVSAPAEINPGLGPVFNHTSCVGCHVRNGRGLPAVGQGPLASPLLVRVSLPEDMGTPILPGGAVPVPGIGTQVGDHAIYGYEPEATVELAWDELPGEYADGTAYSLRRPRLTVSLPDGAPWPDGVMFSGRTPPPVFGLGLLEAVPEEDILALADDADADGDGISGHPNYVWSLEYETEMLGRFGVKANAPTLVQQTAGAYADDMGV